MISKCIFSVINFIQFGHIFWIAPSKIRLHNDPSLKYSGGISTVCNITYNTINAIYKKSSAINEQMDQLIKSRVAIIRMQTTIHRYLTRSSFGSQIQWIFYSRTEKIQRSHPRPQSSPNSWMPIGLRFEKATQVAPSWFNRPESLQNFVIFNSFVVSKCIFV
jgi:hypothetical protein